MEALKVPVWILAVALLTAAGFLGYGILDNRLIELWPPKIHPRVDQPPPPCQASTIACSVAIVDPKLAAVVERHLTKAKLVYATRRITYTIKAIEQDTMIMDIENKTQINNVSDSTVEEELEFRASADYPEPEVVVDGSVINPRRVTATSKLEEVRLYSITMLGQSTKQVTARFRDQKAQLPFISPDLTSRPTLSSELIIEGPPEVMKKLRVDAEGFTWRDNWEVSNPHTPNRITYGWRTQYALLPYQGANIHISLKHH